MADFRVPDETPSSTLSQIPSSTLSPNIYISVRTTAKLYDSRVRLLQKTWFQKVDKEKVRGYDILNVQIATTRVS